MTLGHALRARNCLASGLFEEFYTLEVDYKEGRASERCSDASNDAISYSAPFEFRSQDLNFLIQSDHAFGPIGSLGAELMSLREQLKGYLSLEKELDATIEGCASAPTADAQEALLIGSALGTAPASAQRRIQQSLLLAQELQKKSREARETASKLEKAEMQLASGWALDYGSGSARKGKWSQFGRGERRWNRAKQSLSACAGLAN